MNSSVTKLAAAVEQCQVKSRKLYNRAISEVGAVANYDLLMFIQRGDF